MRLRCATVSATTKGKGMTEAMAVTVTGREVSISRVRFDMRGVPYGSFDWITGEAIARFIAAEAEAEAEAERITFSAPGMSTRFTPTVADLITLGFTAEARSIEMFGATFYRNATRYPEAMPRTIARWFKVSREAANEMHDDTSGSTYTREIDYAGERYAAHYETANGMLTVYN